LREACVLRAITRSLRADVARDARATVPPRFAAPHCPATEPIKEPS